MRQTVGDLAQMQNRPVLIVSMDIRRYIAQAGGERLCRAAGAAHHQELTQQINIQPLGRIVL
ncbi:hypothetical protein P4238_22230 [Pseudomonas aeruginosa]|nr:hypothetical protein [Pseudomonas aeruginosa]